MSQQDTFEGWLLGTDNLPQLRKDLLAGKARFDILAGLAYFQVKSFLLDEDGVPFVVEFDACFSSAFVGAQVCMELSWHRISGRKPQALQGLCKTEKFVVKGWNDLIQIQEPQETKFGKVVH